uniref:GMP phosphodiesterase delta subunit domain-containing protein n=1 Tax=Zooxanthella nutricula TaxID=1333877 RepID=A0A7S2HG73_9DINO
MDVTPEYVNALLGPTDSFLCRFSANVYRIDCHAFTIRAVEDNGERLLFEIRKDPDESEPALSDDIDDSARFIRYHFGPSFLGYPTIGTSLEFTIGEHPLHNFRMIERHYFKNILIKSFDFTLPFVIPNSNNTWEVIYTMPELDPRLKEEIINSPWATKSDSFYFVDNALVMHNKAEYNYGELDAPA